MARLQLKGCHVRSQDRRGGNSISGNKKEFRISKFGGRQRMDAREPT